MEEKHLFITGLGRSGSKLVQNVLRLSPGLTVVSAGETKYFGTLCHPGFHDEIREAISAGGPDCLQRIADLCIRRSPKRGVWNDLKDGRISRDQLIQGLQRVELSAKGVYECILRLRASTAEGDVLLIDKTPQNLYRASILMSWFPSAKFVHMIRDPRAVLASAWTRRMKEYPDRVYFSIRLPRPAYSVMIVLHVSVTWLYAVYLDRRYRARYPDNYVLLRFEDLVSVPEAAIRELTNRLGVDYDHSMANPPTMGSSFGTDIDTGMDRSTLNRWQQILRPWMQTVVKVICGRSMRRVGYTD